MPSCRSCWQQMLVAMKQPVLPIPALRAEGMGGVRGRGSRGGAALPWRVAGGTHLQWTMMGAQWGPSCWAASSTSCTRCRSGGARSGVFWSGQDVNQ